MYFLSSGVKGLIMENYYFVLNCLTYQFLILVLEVVH